MKQQYPTEITQPVMSELEKRNSQLARLISQVDTVVDDILQGKLLEMQQGNWAVFLVTHPTQKHEVLEWCRATLGREFHGFMDTAFGWRLSNWGTWKCQELAYGLVADATKVWLRKPEEITLFRLRWA